MNYRIHTDAIKEFMITPELTEKEIRNTYADEADVLNMALFGITAKDWRKANNDKKGNIRDHASVEELTILINLEALNADMIRQGLDWISRLKKLREIAYYQKQSLIGNKAASRLDNIIRSGN